MNRNSKTTGKSIIAKASAASLALMMTATSLPATALPVYANNTTAIEASTIAEKAAVQIKVASSKTIYKGTTVNVISANKSNLAIKSITSSKKAVATVDKKGNVTALKAGKTTITIKTSKGTKKCKVTVKDSVSFNGASLVTFGSTKQVVKKIESKGTITACSSSNKAVATVTKDGKVKPLKSGFTTITVKVKTSTGKSVKYSKKIAIHSVSGVTVKSAPTKTEYEIGEKFDATGLKLEASYTKVSSKRTIKADDKNLTIKGFDSTEAGTKTITATFLGKSVKFDVTVKAAAEEAKVTDIAVTGVPSEVKVGDDWATVKAGIKVTAVMSDGTEKELTEADGVTISDIDTATAGEQTVTVKYGEFSKEFKVTVGESLLAVESIEVIEAITVTVGDDVVLPETVEVTLNDGNEEEEIEATVVEVAVDWEEFVAEEAGEFDVNGTIVLDEDAEFTISEELAAVTVTVVVEEAALEVVEVSAITANYVTVAITAPAEDMLAQEVEVKNGAGVVVPVKPLDIAAGDETAEFEFVTAVKAADLKGVWTVNNQSYDLDLFNNLSAFLNADDQLALNKALTDLGIANVDAANMPAYLTAKGNVTKTAEELTIADVQKLVDDVNAKAVSAEDEKAIVKAVQDAKTAGNAITLLQALNNDAFVRVNPEWVTDATNGYLTKITAAADTIAKIQTVINTSNDAIVVKQVTTGIDKAKLNATQALIDAWATVDKDGKITDATIKTYPDLINIQLAVADVVAATTPTALKNKLTVLAGLDKANLDMKNYVDANGKAYITALGALADTAKDTTTEIAGVITATNTDEAASLVTAVNTAASAASVDADALLKALNDLGIKQAVEENKADYAKAGASNVELLKTAAGTTKTKVAVQVAVDKINLLAVTEATESTIIAKLNVFGLDNIVAANAKAYETAKNTIGGVTPDAGGDNAETVKLVKAQVKIVNDAVEVDALVKVIKESTDVATTKQALIDLANLGKVANFLATPAADRTFVAEELVAIKDRTTVDTEVEIDTLIGTTINAKITAVVDAANAVTRADNADFAKVKLVLAEFKAYTDLGDLAKVDVQEAFYALLTFPEGTTGTDKPLPVFKSYTEVKVLVDAAIAAQ